MKCVHAKRNTHKLPNVMKLNNESTDNPLKIANLFAKYFESVYEPSDNNMHRQHTNCPCEDHFQITNDHIKNVINIKQSRQHSHGIL